MKKFHVAFATIGVSLLGCSGPGGMDETIDPNILANEYAKQDGVDLDEYRTYLKIEI